MIEPAVADVVGYEDAERESERWRLLGAFSSEEPLWSEIADGGTYFFVVPAEDCAAGNFDQMRVVMDSC